MAAYYGTRFCKKCGKETKRTKRKDCISCILTWRQNNKEKVKAYRKRSRLKRKDADRLYHIEWSKRNIERKRETNRNYMRRHAAKWAALDAKRRIEKKYYYSASWRNWYEKNRDHHKAKQKAKAKRVLLATPKWVDLDQIEKIYLESSRISKETGIAHHVDHIIPITHDLVCGLHVPWNLQIITATENIRKKNRFVNI